MFISGYASDVWIQRETEILQPSCETVLATDRISSYSMVTQSTNRLTRKSAAYRQDTFKTLQEVVNVKLSFELRLTSPICELFRSLLSLYNFAAQTNFFPVEARTWQPEFTDLVRTVKVWIKDQYTGEGYLHEGCAVSECEITTQSRQIAAVTFGLVCLKTTYLPVVTDPGTLRADTIQRPIIAGQTCGVYFTPTDFTDNLAPFMIPGTTRGTMRIARTLKPSRYRQGVPTRFTKTPCEFTGSIDCRINSDLRSFLSMPERYGAAIFKYGQDSNYWLECLLPSVALTYNEAQLHSPTDTPTLTINVYAIEDFTQTGGCALRLYRAPEAWDGGEFGDTDNYQTEGIDGGNHIDNLIQPQPHIDGGNF